MLALHSKNNTCHTKQLSKTYGLPFLSSLEDLLSVLFFSSSSSSLSAFSELSPSLNISARLSVTFTFSSFPSPLSLVSLSFSNSIYRKQQKLLPGWKIKLIKEKVFVYRISFKHTSVDSSKTLSLALSLAGSTNLTLVMVVRCSWGWWWSTIACT